MPIFNTVLVLAPHTDDSEFGCGGTLARLIQEGAAVHYVAFSICEASVPPQFPPDILATEVQEATRLLGILPQNLTVHRYPVRRLPEHRQDILERLVRVHTTLRPDLVFLPSTDDIHQDHQVITQEGIRAFKHTTILGYEFPWNNLQSHTAAFMPLEERHLQRKMDAVRAYKSQEHHNYTQGEFFFSLARVRGRQAGCQYAEAFQVIRWIMR
jgi:LmbE family N-acetylglucosaminyl deacetylase